MVKSTGQFQYFTIEASAEGLFKDRSSKFIAYAFSFTKENQLKALLNEVKKQHPKARHYCWAYRLGLDRSIYRINDDGEPSGTAGRPILNALLSHDLTDIIIVVVRYFGGTLLGVSGLINAYKQASQDVILQADIIQKEVKDQYQIMFDYRCMNDVMLIIKEEDISIIGQHFNHLNCEVTLAIPKAVSSRVVQRFYPHVQAITNKTSAF